MNHWLLLHYKLPNKPSALRVSVWRKLKRLGAILLHEAVWVLPENPRTVEQYQWLTAEIQEMGGSAYYWKGSLPAQEQDQALVRDFNKQVEAVYAQLLKKLERSRVDLQAISEAYRETAAKDFFHSRLGLQVRERLVSKRGERA